MTETKNTKNNEVVAADIDFLPDENPADAKDDKKPVYSTGRGLTEDTGWAMLAEKHEPDWMLAYRLKAYATYRKLAIVIFGPDLSDLD